MKTDMQVIPVYTCICTKRPKFTVHSLPSNTLEAQYYKHLSGRTVVFLLFLIFQPKGNKYNRLYTHLFPEPTLDYLTIHM